MKYLFYKLSDLQLWTSYFLRFVDSWKLSPFRRRHFSSSIQPIWATFPNKTPSDYVLIIPTDIYYSWHVSRIVPQELKDCSDNVGHFRLLMHSLAFLSSKEIPSMAVSIALLWWPFYSQLASRLVHFILCFVGINSVLFGSIRYAVLLQNHSPDTSIFILIPWALYVIGIAHL